MRSGCVAAASRQTVSPIVIRCACGAFLRLDGRGGRGGGDAGDVGGGRRRRAGCAWRRRLPPFAAACAACAAAAARAASASSRRWASSPRSGGPMGRSWRNCLLHVRVAHDDVGRLQQLERAQAGPARRQRRRHPLEDVARVERRRRSRSRGLRHAEAIVPVRAVDRVVPLEERRPRHLVHEVRLVLVGLVLHGDRRRPWPTPGRSPSASGWRAPTRSASRTSACRSRRSPAPARRGRRRSTS